MITKSLFHKNRKTSTEQPWMNTQTGPIYFKGIRGNVRAKNEQSKQHRLPVKRMTVNELVSRENGPESSLVRRVVPCFRRGSDNWPSHKEHQPTD